MEWDSEQECFESFCRETAEFYAMKKDWIFSKPSENQEVRTVVPSLSQLPLCLRYLIPLVSKVQVILFFPSINHNEGLREGAIFHDFFLCWI